MIRTLRVIFILFAMLFSINSFSNDGPAPGDSINSLDLAKDATTNLYGHTNFELTGVCLWYTWVLFVPVVYPTPEVKEYLPDLVVSVYNGKGNDPFWEMSKTLDPAAYAVGNKVVKSLAHTDMANGRESTSSSTIKTNSIHNKTVDVIGNPGALVHFPWIHLRLATTPLMPYYQADLDILGRSGIPELIRKDTYNPLSHYIGKSFANHWSYEFPRSMSVNVHNDYKASIIAAMHAADIATNTNTLHVVHDVSDSCGTNCAISSVEENSKDIEWEMVYPEDKFITPGDSDLKTIKSLGKKVEKEGHGNYVFVLWRKYNGCVQGDHFITATENVPPTTRR